MHAKDLIPIVSGTAFIYAGWACYSLCSTPGSGAENYVRKNSIVRILFFGLTLLGFLGGLSALMVHGLLEGLKDVGADVVIHNSGRGRHLPSGSYSGWALQILLLGCLSLFLGAALGLIRSGLRGFKKRAS